MIKQVIAWAQGVLACIEFGMRSAVLGPVSVGVIGFIEAWIVIAKVLTNKLLVISVKRGPKEQITTNTRYLSRPVVSIAVRVKIGQ